MSDLDNVIAALNLEFSASRRYGFQIERSPYCELNKILEGVRRTEGDHVEAMIDYIKRQQANAPETGRGFATTLAHLRLNLAFERTALDTYGRFAREAEDPELKQTFQHLAHSEAGHINLFKTLIARIEANEYPVMVYCPVCGWELDFGSNPDLTTVLRCAQCRQRVGLEIRDGDYQPVTAPV